MKTKRLPAPKQQRPSVPELYYIRTCSDRKKAFVHSHSTAPLKRRTWNLSVWTTKRESAPVTDKRWEITTHTELFTAKW